MTPTQKHQSDLAKIRQSLRDALDTTPDECRAILLDAIKRTERLSDSLKGAAAKLGSKGGKKTAERGSDWFRQLAAKRKTKGGGRPKKTSDAPHTV